MQLHENIYQKFFRKDTRNARLRRLLLALRQSYRVGAAHYAWRIMGV